MRTCLLLAGAAISLASCGQSTPESPASAPNKPFPIWPVPVARRADAAASDPATTKAPAIRLLGEWEYVIDRRVTDVEGFPAEIGRELLSTPQPRQIQRECVSKAETRADIDKIFHARNKGCKFTRFAAPAGKFASIMVCDGPDHAKLVGTIDGSLAPDALAETLHLASTVPLPAGMRTDGAGATTLTRYVVTLTGRWIGDCPN